MKVVPGSGSKFQPFFDINYGISSFLVIDGGSGYSKNDPPKIVVSGTQDPIVEGIFYPVIDNGEIKSVKVIEPGEGYISSATDEVIDLGDTVQIKTNIVNINSTTTIIELPISYRSSKILLGFFNSLGKYEFDELTIIHNGTEVELLEYGQLTDYPINPNSSSGFGTYYPYISGGNIKVDFIPSISASIAANVLSFSTSDINSSVGIETVRNAKLESNYVTIPSSVNPSLNSIAYYGEDYDSAYFIVTVSDIDNNIHQISEIVIVSDDDESYMSEFGILSTNGQLGEFSTEKSGVETHLYFTPIPNINVQVRVYQNSLGLINEEPITIEV